MSILHAIGGIIGGAVGFATGGVGGAVSGFNTGARIGDAAAGHPSGQSPPAAPTGQPIPFAGVTGIGSGLTTSIDCDPTSFAGSMNWLAGKCFGSSGGTAMTTTCGGHKGYHMNKSILGPTRGGCGRSARSGWTAKGTTPVRNRHMHPLNSRAAMRAIRRLKAAHRMFRKIDRFVGPKRHASRPFRRRRA